jgi:hypothetical protein
MINRVFGLIAPVLAFYALTLDLKLKRKPGTPIIINYFEKKALPV